MTSIVDAPSYLFTSESVTEGHPDKMCDQISDAILDAIIGDDPHARVACETATTTGLVLVLGEITTSTYVDFQRVIRETVREIGYTKADYGFDYQTCGALVSVKKQSPDIAQGVDARELGAGDQGMMFGYACTETPELMPMPIQLAQRLVQRLAVLRRNGTLTYVRPDSKSQVTIEYSPEKKPVRIHTVVISTQHDESICGNGGKGDVKDSAKREIIEKVIMPVLPAEFVDRKLICHINPTGRFVVGGPHGDTGLTGRKIICDTYGGMGRHGGGAFSGKDPSKVDRSAAYAVRWMAKNIVAAKLAERCEVQVAYAIGVARPISVSVDTFGTGKIADEHLTEIVKDLFDLRPAAIIEQLNLRRPIYEITAAYGHFGRNEDTFTWEKTNRVKDLLAKV